jgi:methylenetetrahydrofolate dehydrogenase (NADP+)/methenyltetrahydrofolate cyclohydrolase
MLLRDKIIQGSLISQEVLEGVSSAIKSLPVTPKLAILLVGHNPASHLYVKIKSKKAKELLVEVDLHQFDETISERELLLLIDELNRDKSVHGILIQLPLPKHINKGIILESIVPYKDVDGFSPINIGRLACGRADFIPCTALGVLHLIKSVQKDLTGLRAIVIGRSNIVGKPVAELLLQENATVTIAHSKSINLSQMTKESDIIVAAAGVPELITGSFVKKGALIIDVGINKKLDGSLVGDVDLAGVLDLVQAISPVPGGVGPMTVAYLLHNTILACKKSFLID